jgi:hypothetical protein
MALSVGAARSAGLCATSPTLSVLMRSSSRWSWLPGVWPTVGATTRSRSGEVRPRVPTLPSRWLRVLSPRWVAFRLLPRIQPRDRTAARLRCETCSLLPLSRLWQRRPRLRWLPHAPVVTTSDIAEARFAHQAYLAHEQRGSASLPVLLTRSRRIETHPEGVLGPVWRAPSRIDSRRDLVRGYWLPVRGSQRRLV